MAPQIVNVPSIMKPIQPCPGFLKKLLADYKLDRVGLCGYGCLYCSSNEGYYLRTKRAKFADLTEQQLGVRSLPGDNPKLMFDWPDFPKRLAEQLAHERPGFGKDKTLVYSMLTDGFHPYLVNSGATMETLCTLLERTECRIRVLTKNSIVGKPKWLDFFSEHADRFVVGLSIGTMDDEWAKQVELFTPPPSSRLKGLAHLQDAGIATYGMLCPVFPDALQGDQLEELVDGICPHRVEHVWAEPYNDRKNWEKCRAGYKPGSHGYQWFTEVYLNNCKHMWSEYATELYVRLRNKARREKWLHKLRYLLYERNIAAKDAKHFRGLKGVLLQSKPGKDGKSQNPHIAALQ